MDTSSERQQSPTEPSPEKQPYQPPRLIVYGNVRDLTRSHGFNGNHDGTSNTGANSRTGP